MTDDSQIWFAFPLHSQNLEEKFRQISTDVGGERTLYALLFVSILTLRSGSSLDYFQTMINQEQDIFLNLVLQESVG